MLAARPGISAHTLRYYERIGLVDVGRDERGHRCYDEAAVARITFLGWMRRSEMGIVDLRRYVELAREGDHTAPERLALLAAHRDEVLARRAEFDVAIGIIERKLDLYRGRRS